MVRSKIDTPDLPERFRTDCPCTKLKCERWGNCNLCELSRTKGQIALL